LGVQHILPAHGGVMDAPLQAIAHLKAHRLKREAKVAAAIQAQPDGDLDSWLPLAYDDVAPQIWPVARRSLRAHVERLHELATQTRP
jgi:transposase